MHTKIGSSTLGRTFAYVEIGSLTLGRTFAYVEIGSLTLGQSFAHIEKAYSHYASEKVMKLLKGDNKELLIIPGASHCDLYDGGKDKVIPFDKIEAFFNENLK